MSPNPPGKVFLIVGSVLFGVTGLLGCLHALLSPMFFDAPGSIENPATTLMFRGLST